MQRNKSLILNHKQTSQTQKFKISKWLKPSAKQFHLVNDPSLTFKLSEYSHEECKNSQSFFQEEVLKKEKKVKRNSQRNKYKKIRQEIIYLEKTLNEIGQLRESELLQYKQKILSQYLSQFIKEITIECHEKASFVSQIWNLLIKIFNQLFKRLTKELTSIQQKSVKNEINFHQTYQEEIQKFQIQNIRLTNSQAKYQKIVSELISHSSKCSKESKSNRLLYELSKKNQKELNLKYDQLKSEFKDYLINGTCNMSEKQADDFIQSRQIQIAQQPSNKIRKRKIKSQKMFGGLIHSQMDINLVIQQIQVESQEEMSFEEIINQKEDKSFENKKVQTQFFTVQKTTKQAQTQVNCFSLYESHIIVDKSSQTIKDKTKYYFNQGSQWQAQFLSEDFTFVNSCCNYKIFPTLDKSQNVSTQFIGRKGIKKATFPFKVLTNQQKNQISYIQPQQLQNSQNHDLLSLEVKQPDFLKKQSCIAFKTKKKLTEMNEPFQEGTNNTMKSSKKVVIQGAKMLKKQGKRAQAEKISPLNSSKKSNYHIKKPESSKKTRVARISSFLVAQQILKLEATKISHYKRQFQQKQESLIDEMIKNIAHENQSQKSLSIVNIFNENLTIQNFIKKSVMEFYQKKTQNKYNHRLYNLNIQNQNKNLIKIITKSIIEKKKSILRLSLPKCIKIIGEIFILSNKILNQNHRSLNFLDILNQYYDAEWNNSLTEQQIQNKVADFIICCISFCKENFICKNFLLLCGIKFSSFENSEYSGNRERLGLLKKAFKTTSNMYEKFKKQKNSEFMESFALENFDIQKNVYSSEVIFYLRILYQLNLSSHLQDLSQFYTNVEKLVEVLPLISQHYPNSQILVEQLQQQVYKSVNKFKSNESSVDHANLNIFKCLHLIMERIICQKGKIMKFYEPIYRSFERNIHEFFYQILNFYNLTAAKKTLILKTWRQSYSGQNIEDLCSILFIEGLQVSFEKPPSVVSKKMKSIIDNLPQKLFIGSFLLQSLVNPLNKKRLTRFDEPMVLKILSKQQQNKVLQNLIGEQMLALYLLSVPFSCEDSCKGTKNYHKEIRENN